MPCRASLDIMNTDTRAILAHLPLFQALSDDQREQLLAGVSAVHLNKGKVLFFKGDPVTGFYAVVYGQVKLTVQSAGGEEKVVEIIGPRQSFGEAVMFLGRPYPVTAQALTDCLLLHVASECVDALLASDTTFARRMLAGISVRLHSLIKDVETYSLDSSVQRVMGYLLQQCPEEGDGAAETRVVLPASKHVVASRLNLVPETLSRILTDLARAGLIEVEGRTIIVKTVAGLREYTGPGHRRP
jgi:CRP/FNR family transcriptional regulator, dissimilatory nitrate respiration regulator